jgi:hypothetical protein
MRRLTGLFSTIRALELVADPRQCPQRVPALWEDFMAELRTEHLGAPPPPEGPTATERLASAYAEAVAREAG